METLFNEDFEPGCYLLDIFFVHALEHFDCMFALSDAIAVLDLIVAFAYNCSTSDNYGSFNPVRAT